MKKRGVVLLISSMALAIAFVVYAVYLSSRTLSYSSELPDGCSCQVDVKYGEVFVKAYDPHFHDKGLTQTVIIHRDWIEKYERISMSKKNDSLFIFKGSGYDVFYVKCRPFANSLPPGVKKLFQGYWGIE